MINFEEILNTRLVKSQNEYTANTDVVSVMANLLNQVNTIALSSVNNANATESSEEKLQLINHGMIAIVNLVERTAVFSKESVYKYRFESALLKELAESNSQSVSVQEEEVENEEGAEPEEQEAETEPTE